MRIAVIADVHANVVALNAVLAAIDKQGYDTLYHLGDAINLGPFPAETVDRLLNIPRAKLIMGNHDSYFVHSLTNYIPRNPAELEHYTWSNAQLNPSLKDVIAKWPYIIHEYFGNLKVSFAHYGLTETENDFLPITYEPRVADLDPLFDRYDSDVFMFGHIHKVVSALGAKHYLNPGSVGVNNRGRTPYTLLDIHDNGTYDVQQYQIAYDMSPVIQAFYDRKVPNAEQIIRVFYR